MLQTLFDSNYIVISSENLFEVDALVPVLLKFLHAVIKFNSQF